MNKQKVKVILKVAEELWASKSFGYKKFQLATKKSMTLQTRFTSINITYSKYLPLFPLFKKIISLTLFNYSLLLRGKEKQVNLAGTTEICTRFFFFWPSAESSGCLCEVMGSALHFS